MNQKDHAGDDPGDLDEPTPPGGPLRGDAPSGAGSPGTPATEPGPEVERVTKRGDTGASAPQGGASRPEQSSADAERQRANAEAGDAGEPSQ